MRCLVPVFFLIGFFLSTYVSEGIAIDSTTKVCLQNLSEKMRLKTPKLAEGEYEVRIWNRQGLMYGDAQVAYVLRKTEKRFTPIKYSINSNQQGFQFARRLKPTVKITPVLWKRLLQQNILTLPDQSIVFERLYPKPEPTKDTIQTRVEIDGSFTIKAKKIPKRRFLISDGEGYLFEVFSMDSYHVYSYSNPYYYRRDEPDCEELQNVVGILNDLSLLFRSDKQSRDQAKVINKD